MKTKALKAPKAPRVTKAQLQAQAEAICGSLSEPSKMPCHGYSIPASKCITGTKLREVEGTTCSDCYACKGRYPSPNVQNAMSYRFGSLDNPYWVDAIVSLIRMTKDSEFRWHDSGDVQSVEHLHKIVLVANALPEVLFWLPTREYKIALDYEKQFGKLRTLAPNLCVRFSAHMVDSAAPNYGFPTSTVHTSSLDNPFKMINSIPADSHVCPSRNQGNKCQSCRACWDPTITNVSYPKH